MTYHYTITIDNQGEHGRTVDFKIRNSQNVIFGLKKEGWDNYETEIYSMGDKETDWQKVTVELPANKITTFEVVTLPCAGKGGMNNALILSELKGDR